MPRRKIDIALPSLDPDAYIYLEDADDERGGDTSQPCGKHSRGEKDIRASRLRSETGELSYKSRETFGSTASFGVQVSTGWEPPPDAPPNPDRPKGLRRSATGLVVIHQDGRTLLHDAVMRGDLQKVEGFLNTGCAPDVRTNGQLTPMHFAAVYRRTAIASLLLERAAKMDVRDDQGLTALHLAAEFGAYQIVEMLLKSGANVNDKDNLQNTPLHVAALRDNIQLAEALLEAGACLDAKNSHGYTAIAIAEECSTRQMVDSLQAARFGSSGGRVSNASYGEGSLTGAISWKISNA